MFVSPFELWERRFVHQESVREVAVVVLGALTALYWVGYFSLDLTAPAQTPGDHFFILESARGYVNGHGLWLNPDLGFPEGRDLTRFPSFEPAQRIMLWLFARLTRNPFVAVHLLYVFAISATYALTYFSLRYFEVRWWLAGMLSVTAVVTPYLAFRAFGHDFLAMTWSVPMGAALALSFGLQPSAYQSRCFLLLCSAAVLLLGTSGLYYAFFGLMFVWLVATATSIGRVTLVPPGVAAVVTLAIVVLLAVSGFGWRLVSGEFSRPVRYPFEQLMFGLSIPGAAELFALSPILQANIRVAGQMIPAFFSYEGVSEWPGPALTLALLCSPLAVASLSFFPATEGSDRGRHFRQLLYLSAICAVFGLLFAVRGGLGFLFSLFLSPEIRAQGRIMPYLTLFAVAMSAAGVELALLNRRAWVRWSIPLVLLSAVLASVMPLRGAFATKQQQFVRDGSKRADVASVEQVLRLKDAAGAMNILQLPVLPWPEVPPRVSFDVYQHLLPYVLDSAPGPTRWSYGATTHQPAFAMNFGLTSRLESLALNAKTAGYDAIILEKRAYYPAQYAFWDEHLSKTACKIFEDELRSFYLLARAASQDPPCLPGNAIQFNLLPTYNVGAPTGAALLLGGWLRPWGEGWFTSGNRAELVIPVPSGAAEIEVKLHLTPDLKDLASKKVAVNIGNARREFLISAHGPPIRTISLRLPVPEAGPAALICAIELVENKPAEGSTAPSLDLGLFLAHIEIQKVQ